MEDSLQERAKPKKMRVRFADGTVFLYASVKKTFIETLKKIGSDRLNQVKLEVCHLPMFSQTVYENYKDFMEPIGGGWYVNTQGNTYNKYAQLISINNQLNLGLEIDLSEDFKGERVKRGHKGMCVLEVKFPNNTVIGELNTGDTFIECIWNLGIENVRKLNLKQGGKDLITSTKLYNGQVQVDSNRWLLVPGALKDKVKILRVINAMLHANMEITSFSTSEEKSYKRIGNKKKS